MWPILGGIFSGVGVGLIVTALSDSLPYGMIASGVWVFVYLSVPERRR